MAPSSLMSSLGRTVLVGSGALGTSLRKVTDLRGAPVELLNLRQPDAVRALHAAYREAGSQVLVTNTFAANRLLLEEAGCSDRLADLHQAGVRLAREAAGNDALVWASLGPLSLGLRLDDFTDHDLFDLYAAPCDSLREADAILLETFTDPREAGAALRAARKTGLPIVFQVGNLGSGRGRWERLEALLALAVDADVVSVGANCQHPNEIVETVRYLAGRTSLPLTASPNAGHPSLNRGLIAYDFPAEGFHDVAEALRKAGASVIGGCCGTTVAHIERVAAAVKGRPVTARPALRLEPAAVISPEARQVRENPIRTLMRSDRFLISVEIRADRKASLETIVAGASVIARAGADLFDVPDNPGATVGRDAGVVAAQLQKELGIPAMPHKSVIQSNLLQIHSTLIGAWDLGLQGLVVVTGDPPSMGHLSGMARIVQDLKSSVEMFRLLRNLREGKMINGEPVADAPDFCAGGAVGQPTRAQVEWLRKKAEAGAEFVFSQPVFSLDDFRRLRDAVTPVPIRFFPGLMPLVSRKAAEFLAGGRIPGIRVPESLLTSLQSLPSPEDQRRFGLDHTRELAAAIARESRGLYLIMPFGRTCYADTAELVRGVPRPG